MEGNKSWVVSPVELLHLEHPERDSTGASFTHLPPYQSLAGGLGETYALSLLGHHS